MSENEFHPQKGMRLGNDYQLTKRLGRGGMGEVWRAQHLRLPKEVAVKFILLPEGAGSRDGLVRFRREAEIACKLKHPHVIEVFDFNELPNGAHYLVMELLSGQSLADLLAQQALGPADAVRYASQVGSALAACHAMGVVHRDLKPDNIFIVQEPHAAPYAKVLDFGVSKLSSATLKTADHALIGTPQYMSPEQISGRNSETGPQSDVFSLAAVTYEMLCGQPPFSGETPVQLLLQITQQAHTPLKDRLLGVDGLSEVLDRALAKDPQARTPSCEQFVQELRLSAGSLADSQIRPRTVDLAATVRPEQPSRPLGSNRVQESTAALPTPVRPAANRASSRRRLQRALGLGAVGLASGLTLLMVAYGQKKTDGDALALAPLPPPPSNSIQPDPPPPLPTDAGALAPAAVPPAPSATSAQKPEEAPALVPPPRTQLSAAEAAAVGDLDRLYKSGDLAEVVRKVSSALSQVKSTSARRQIYFLGAQAACRRGDAIQAGKLYRSLGTLQGTSEQKRVRALCRSAGLAL